MAVARSIPTPIFDVLSSRVESPVFFVEPGEIAQVQAFGFACRKAKLSETERSVPQIATLEQVMFKEAIKDVATTVMQGSCACTKLYNKATEILATEPVMLCGNCVQISASNNHLLINTPGAYRFVLNDVTALTNVQVFIRTFTHNEFPWDSSLFIGERL